MYKILSLLFLSLIFTVTIGQVTFKNTGWSKIYVAICYYNNSSGWTSKGWFPIEPNEEKNLYSYNSFSNPHFYYCATIENCDKGYFGNTPMYVDIKNGFSIPNANKMANYTSNLIKQYDFKEVNLQGKSKYVVELQPINLTCGGKPQGKWRLLLDKESDYAEKNEDAVYYREITFDNGEPIGWCKDYYNDGTVKSEFKLLSFNPLKYDGKCVWYKQDGSIEKETVYKNGSQTNLIAYDSNGGKETKTAKHETVELPIQNFYINSTSNELLKGGNSKTIFPVSLPEGTIEWYYEFTASRDKEEVQKNSEQFNLASKLTSLVDKTGILSISVNMLTAPPGGSNCNVYLIDGKYFNQFLSGDDYKYNIAGSRLNYKSGVVQVREPNLHKPMIGIKNPDIYYGIHVSIQVVAIVSKLD